MATELGGPWTEHGHDIPGLTRPGPGRPPRARCGGPLLCVQCALDAARYLEEEQDVRRPSERTEAIDLLEAASVQLETLLSRAFDGPWEYKFRDPTMGGETWIMRTQGVPGIRLSAVEYQHGSDTAVLIATLRAVAPALLETLRKARTQLRERGRVADFKPELEMARLILEPREGRW